MIGSDIPPPDEIENDRRRIASICEILSNERRVVVIDVLAAGEKASITQVIDDLIADSENEDARKRINTALYQTHLPKLKSYNLIAYDWEENEIQRGPQYRLVRHALDAIREDN